MEEQAEYFDRFDTIALEKEGYLVPLTQADRRVFEQLRKAARAQRQREQVNISLEPEHFSKLARIAAKKHLRPATLARAWLLERLESEQSARPRGSS